MFDKLRNLVQQLKTLTFTTKGTARLINVLSKLHESASRTGRIRTARFGGFIFVVKPMARQTANTGRRKN